MIRTLLATALIALAACSVNHRSDEFTCETPNDCASGRTCVDGFCVAAAIDAGVKPPDAMVNACPTQCTSCNADSKSCMIDCAANGGACNQPITCPSGWSCTIACSTANSCRSGINCSGARSCTITCGGRQSCSNFMCGPGPCNVDCSGRQSCTQVSCGMSCACSVTCHLGLSECSSLTCKAAQCTLPNRGGCSTQPLGCNTCPITTGE